ncbi:MAG: hypothetical protein A2452_11170 [Candidatus Firestonebacteria bacterium RIFOXYC2_FULL_39_67]|nr:MAG: hypothetical protein A2452_11170 [Candidatus Firestonebacteria bacterium RIFOXYC2_FULL_39_67]
MGKQRDSFIGEIAVIEHQSTPRGRNYFMKYVKPGDPEYKVALMEWALMNTKLTYEEIKENICS